LAEIGRPRDLIARWTGSKRLAVGAALFCGALTATEPPPRVLNVSLELDDPVLGRSLAHRYQVQGPRRPERLQ